MSAPSSQRSASPISTAVAVIAGSAALIVGISLIAHYAVDAYSSRSLKGDPAMSDEAVARRLKPVGELVVVDANAPKVSKTGEQVYTATCAGCHAAGVAGAPKFGDKTAWASRISAGYDALVKNAINGIRAMPARGGNPDLSDVEIAGAVVHIANASGAKFKAPEPAAAETAKPAQPETSAPSLASTGKPSAPEPVAAPTSAAPATSDANKGKSVFDTSCSACHGTGVAGAPKLGDKAAWGPRVTQGAKTLHDHAIKGFQGKTGVMPPKGGNISLADDDVSAAVDYMVSQAK